jgi:hypothetical protein
MSSLTRHVGQGMRRRWQSKKLLGVLYQDRRSHGAVPYNLHPLNGRESYSRREMVLHSTYHIATLLVRENAFSVELLAIGTVNIGRETNG